jgi:hypothetical protein
MTLAEKEGFEPPIPWIQNNGFQDRRIRPLCHFSKKYISTLNSRPSLPIAIGTTTLPFLQFVNFSSQTKDGHIRCGVYPSADGPFLRRKDNIILIF